MANKVEICGVDTARLPLYKEAEMTEMLEKIKAGDDSVLSLIHIFSENSWPSSAPEVSAS